MVTVADTAYSIAVVRAEESAQAVPLFDDPYARLFAAEGAHAEEATQRFLTLPNFRDAVRLRTRYIDDFVRDGLARGLRQVVLLGAGFDARGLRMPEIAGARVYEVDFAEQLARKRAILEKAGVVVPERIAYVACDFADPSFDRPLAEGLEAAGFRRGAGALFVWEGVIGYIDQATMDRSLAFMAREGGKGSGVVFNFAQDGIDPDTADAMTRRAGFGACDEVGLDAVWRMHLPGEPHENAWVVRMARAWV
jgi:methyltransferase (TIGR00027 family)